MSIQSLSYSEYKGEANEWILKECDFQEFNLIVGTNATGKTRLVNVIHALLRMLAGWQKEAYLSGNYDTTICLNNKKYRYEVDFFDGKVLRESLSVDGINRLTRNKAGRGKIYYHEIEDFIDFQIAESSLALQQRADALQHPFVSELAEWANGARMFSFNTSFSNTTLTMANNLNSPVRIQPSQPETNLTRTYVSAYERFGDKFDIAIRRDMKKLGYDLTDVGAGDVAEMGLKHNANQMLVGIFASERGMDLKLRSDVMSQGMFRALGLIISINAAALANDHTVVLVDDIGEGLDYERSVSLLEVVKTHSRKSKLQVIMTTNDRFIMNKVPLENWIILRRRNSVVQAYTERNSAKKFKEFRYMGLSNFDLFASPIFR